MNRFPAIDGAPSAEKKPFVAKFHGVELVDNYHWLRADNWQEATRDPSRLPAHIRAYLEAENDYFEKAMADTTALQETLIAEMRGRIREDDLTVPDKDGPFAYSWKYSSGAEHPAYVRTPRDGGEEQILLDASHEAKELDYFNLGFVDYNPAHEILAWSRDTSGAELFSLVFRDLATGKDSHYKLDDVGSACWGDNETLFYTKVDHNHRPSKVFRHTLGSDPAQDVLVYEEQDPRFFCSVYRSRTGDFVFISASMNDQREIRFISTLDLAAEPRIIEPRTEGLEYSVEHQRGAGATGENGEGRFLILTNADGAEDFKVMETPVTKPGRQNWRDFIPYRQGRMVLVIEALADWIIWLERENALPRISYMDRHGNISHIEFEEEAYALGLGSGAEYEVDTFRFSYSSMTTPSQLFDFNMATGERILLKEQEIPSGHDPHQYITHRLEARSHDGVMVPYTLVHHIDTPIDGSAPCLLYGYGSYGMSMPSNFETNRLSLVDRNFIYCIAHVRGGQEKGRKWYEDAKFDKKPNTFHDFIAVALSLCEQQFTNKGNIVIQGGSAGGLLVGASVNMRPDLFAGVIADVPFVDMLNTILDPTLPLTPGEWSQWGNPIESVEAFKWIRSYSPYDNIRSQHYPAMLVTAGVSDPRVTYWEAAKWVAKLRTLENNNILMLHTNMSAGHFGKSGRFAALADTARSYAFALKATGKADKTSA